MPRPAAGRLALFVALGTVLILAGIVALVFFSQSTLTVTRRTRQDTEAEMQAIRARFSAPPCLEAGRGDPAPVSRPGPAPTSVHMLAWEREDERLVRVSTPYWALQAGSWKMNAARAIAPPLDHVSLADLQRCGRGLIVDRRTAGGGHVLIWTE